MEKQVEKNFTWVIKYPICLSYNCFSDPFLIVGCQWRLNAVLNGENLELLYQYRGVTDSQSLPSDWRKHVKLRLTIVNRLSEKLSIVTDSELYFDEKSPMHLLYPTVLPPSKLLAKDGGFLVNGEVMILVEAVAHEVISSLGVLDETVDVNGFQVLPSQVEALRRIFKRYPDFSSTFIFKNRHLKSTYMNLLLGIIETLCQAPQELSDADLKEASVAVSNVANVGFKVDWLDKMLKEVKEKKKKVDVGKASVEQMEEELQKYNQKCLDLKALVKKKKEDVSAANVRLSFDDDF
ncbi:unnamed protein product [Thlaspi arvense]|uniref:MATH domain-containing protein n=1 Tax=Thlaspi arvense TaxID=13288 RepID=A0AAU9TA62_THLAR|nr:unnamed protein product [Thlaspi arvense]